MTPEKEEAKTVKMPVDRGEEMVTEDRNELEQLDKGSIQFENVSAKWAKDLAVNSINNISLTIEPGQLVAIIGHIGAGKVCIKIRV